MEARLKACGVMQVELASGSLVVAHEKGEVRVYQFSPGRCDAVSLELNGRGRHPKHEEESGRCIS